ncbi:MAG TPA: alanine racemase [Candidatus Dormibacteraeota bacterium]|nr:alanine racemase [Candidatus Dormibacteraeota bacterium]
MTRTVKFEGRPIWAEVSLGSLTHNLRAIRRHVNPAGGRGARRPRRKILAVIKSNAYGHGIVPVAQALSRARADWFGVTCSAEGAELRESGIREPVLILTGFWAGEEQRILENHLTPAIMRPEQLRLLEKAAARSQKVRGGRKARRGPVEFHLKIDSGMNRLGIHPSEIPAFARVLAECPHLRLAGTFTHIASSEVFTTEQTAEQEVAFDAALACMRSLGLDPGIVHMANSAAIVSRPSTWCDMVRPGAILYGYHQFFEPPELNPKMEAKLSVRPVLSFRARIISIKQVAPGARVGYNGRWTAASPSRVAVLAAGYADGLVRVLSNKGRVIVRGQLAPIIGTVSMDLTAADITGIASARVGDIATIYGTDGGTTQSVPDVARIANTASAELLCALGKRVPRFYLP